MCELNPLCHLQWYAINLMLNRRRGVVKVASEQACSG